MSTSDYDYIKKGGLRSKSDVIKQQNDIAAHFDLGWWYGTWCKKCCDVYPIFMKTDDFSDLCYYQCEVCGRKSKKCVMPWVARDDWNSMEFDLIEEQISLFQYL